MEPAVKLRRVHGDTSLYESCCWIATVLILLGVTYAAAVMVAPK